MGNEQSGEEQLAAVPATGAATGAPKGSNPGMSQQSRMIEAYTNNGQSTSASSPRHSGGSLLANDSAESTKAGPKSRAKPKSKPKADSIDSGSRLEGQKPDSGTTLEVSPKPGAQATGAPAQNQESVTQAVEIPQQAPEPSKQPTTVPKQAPKSGTNFEESGLTSYVSLTGFRELFSFSSLGVGSQEPLGQEEGRVEDGPESMKGKVDNDSSSAQYSETGAADTATAEGGAAAYMSSALPEKGHESERAESDVGHKLEGAKTDAGEKLENVRMDTNEMPKKAEGDMKGDMSHKLDEVKSDASEAFERAGSKAGHTMEKMKADASEAFEKAGTDAAEMFEKAKTDACEMLERAGSKAAPLFEKAKTDVGDALQKAKMNASDALQKTGEDASEMIGNARAEASEIFEKAGAEASYRLEKAGEGARQMMEKAGEDARQGASSLYEKAREDVVHASEAAGVAASSMAARAGFVGSEEKDGREESGSGSAGDGTGSSFMRYFTLGGVSELFRGESLNVEGGDTSTAPALTAESDVAAVSLDSISTQESAPVVEMIHEPGGAGTGESKSQAEALREEKAAGPAGEKSQAGKGASKSKTNGKQSTADRDHLKKKSSQVPGLPKRQTGKGKGPMGRQRA